jgi:hypothetical protein
MGAGEGFQTSGVNYFSFPKSKRAETRSVCG